MEWLLGEGADVTKKSANGQSILPIATRKDIQQLLMDAAGVDADRRPKKAAPTMVGGYLPHQEGGTKDDYYWPHWKYDFKQTFAHRRANPEARGCDIDCDDCRCSVLFFTRQ